MGICITSSSRVNKTFNEDDNGDDLLTAVARV